MYKHNNLLQNLALLSGCSKIVKCMEKNGDERTKNIRSNFIAAPVIGLLVAFLIAASMDLGLIPLYTSLPIVGISVGAITVGLLVAVLPVLAFDRISSLYALSFYAALSRNPDVMSLIRE